VKAACGKGLLAAQPARPRTRQIVTKEWPRIIAFLAADIYYAARLKVVAQTAYAG
jgi:hypothetical protein